MYIEKNVNNRWEIIETISMKDDEESNEYEKRAVKVYNKWRCRPEAITGIRLINDAGQISRLCHA